MKLRRINHGDELVSGFSRLLRTESMTDVTLICKGGQTIRAHRVVLSTFSPYFRAIFEAQPFANNPCQYPVIVIKDLELSELRAIVDFIYRGEVSVVRDKLPMVLQAARALEVSGLADLKVDQLTGPSSASSNSLLASSNGDHMQQSQSPILASHEQPLQINVTSTNLAGKRTLPNKFEMELGVEKKNRLQLDNQNDVLLLSAGNGASLLDNSSVSSSGSGNMRSLLQQHSNNLQQQYQASQQQLSSIMESLKKKHQIAAQQRQLQQQRQQLQQKIQMQQLKQQVLKLNQSTSPNNQIVTSPIVQSPLNGIRKGGPRVSHLQGAQLLLFQQRLQQQMQEKARKHEMNRAAAAALAANGAITLEKFSSASASLKRSNSLINIAEPEVRLEEEDEPLSSDSIKHEPNDERPSSQANSIENCGDMVETQLLIDDENNNSIVPNSSDHHNGNANNHNEENEDQDDVATGNDENEAVGASGNGADVEEDAAGEEACEMVQTHLLQTGGEDDEDDDDLYQVNIDKDAFFQRQQQMRLEQLQKQQHFKEQFQLMHVSETEQRMMDLQEQLQRVVSSSVSTSTVNSSNNALCSVGGNGSTGSNGLSAAATELLESLGLSASVGMTTRRSALLANGKSMTSGKDSAAQNSSASGSEPDTDNDNNTMDTLQDGFFDEYSNLSSKSPISIQVQLDPQVTNIAQTPDFLLPRGPGRPRKGNKSSDISPCPACNKVFVRPDVLKLHYRSVHLNERHPCNMCSKIFKWPGDLSKHKRTKHPEAFPPANSASNSMNSMLAIN